MNGWPEDEAVREKMRAAILAGYDQEAARLRAVIEQGKASGHTWERLSELSSATAPD